MCSSDLYDRMLWTQLPKELKVLCFRLLSSENILQCSCACRADALAVDAEELWALLFHRDWKWLCTDGPCLKSSARQSHRRVARKVQEFQAAFVVLGGCVRRGVEGRHRDGSVLSVLTPDRDKLLSWRSFGTLPLASRCAAGVCSSGSSTTSGRMVVAGGFDFSEEVALASCEAISISGLLSGQPVVEACPSLQRPRAVLAVGGGSSMFTAAEAFSSVEVLPLGAQQWLAGPSLKKPRCAAGVCVTDSGHAFAVSGYAGNEMYEASVEWLDLSSEGLRNGWHFGPQLSQARAGCAACFGPDGCVWVLGGGCDESASLDTVERLDPRVGRWQEAPIMPGRRRCFAASFGVDRKLYIYGGWNRERWHEDSAARLDLRNLCWETLPSPMGEADSIIPYHFVSGCTAL